MVRLIRYLNGDNSLHYSALDDMAEIWTAGYSSEVHVVVLADTYFEDAKEKHLGPNQWHILNYPGELDMADWTVLRDFALRNIDAFPAHRYALIIWNHGDGWNKPSPAGDKSISQDVHGTAGVISVANGDLTAALLPVSETLGRPLDLLGIDACLMGMWEVAVALDGAAEILLVSQETVPADGWSYDDIFTALNAAPELDGGALAGVIAETFHGADVLNSTISALVMTELLTVNDAVDALGSVLIAASEDWEAVETARLETQAFQLDEEDPASCSMRDLYHLTERLDSSLPTVPGLTDATAAVRDALDAFVRINLTQASHPDAHGLSVHFPGREEYFPAAYLSDEAPWSGSAWTNFVQAFSTPVPSTWTCASHWFAAGDQCDCGCGAWDPDCDSGHGVYGCAQGETCVPPGLCQDVGTDACPDGALQCAGDLLLATCADEQWSTEPCAAYISCPDAGPPMAICWNPQGDGTPECICIDDQQLCAGIACGDNGYGHLCGVCAAGALCYDGRCFSQGLCAANKIVDCMGTCWEPGYVGNGYCDDGYGGGGPDFDCELFLFDLGDCPH